MNRPFPIYDGDCPLTQKEVANLLNEQFEQIHPYKTIIDEQESLLNELYEENQQLKKEIRFFQSTLHDKSFECRQNTLNEVEDEINKLERYE